MRSSRRDDLDALDLDAFDGRAFFTATATLRRNRGNTLEDVVSFDQLTKSGVLAVEELRIAVTKKELAAGRIRMSGARHRDHAANVRLGIELGLDLVTRITGARHSAFAFAGVGATALDHETFDDAMERGAIIKFLAREFLEVLDRFGRDVRPEGERHFTVGSLDDGVFRRRFGSAHKRRSEPRASDARKNQNERDG